MRAINLFQFDLDKRWNYLWYFHKMTPPGPFLPIKGQVEMHPLSDVPDFHPKGNWYYAMNPSDFTDSTVATSPVVLRWLYDSPRTGCARRTTPYIYVARTSNNRVIMACELYCCLLPQCEALRICRSGFPIATVLYYVVGFHLRFMLTSPD